MEDWIARNGLQVVRRERLRTLSQKSDLRGWIQTLSHVAAIAVSSAGLVFLVPLVPLTWLPLFLVQGILINCLYAGQHELSHWTVFRTKGLNDLVGLLFGFLTLNPFYTDRFIHFAHHRATHDPDRDPEIMGTGPYTFASYLLDFSGISFWWRRVTGILRTALGRGLETAYWLGPAEARIVVLEARMTVGAWIVIAAVSVVFRSWSAVSLWIAPMLLTKWFHQLQNMGEHTALAHDPDTFKNTRTLRGPAVMRWLMWNMSYHTAHHCFPGVPFHKLPPLHAEIVANLDHPVATRGYLEAQRDIFASLLSPGPGN